ncbi:MAG: hypothetical protein GXP39_02740 [Chloroflexi bacterium]|nr:hypothetical protein [Chloroflexota bacterium]
MGRAIAWLEAMARREIAGCRLIAHDGTVLFTPDGQGNYAALWTRDFAYMVEYAFGLMMPEEVRAAIAYLLRGQRADGCVPDRVQADGMPVYSAGPVEAPLGDPPTDNAQFMVSLVHAYVDRTGDLAFAREHLGALRRALDFVPRSGDGLVYIPPGRRQSPYGFTDTVAKTGELLFSSLLYWVACRQMADLCTRCGEEPSPYHRRAGRIERGLDRLWDEDVGAYRAATVDCRQIDVWGSAFAVYIDFVRGDRRERVLRFLRDRYEEYVWRGQVRHLLRGEYWERLLIPVEPDTYQNGAYWAAASGWVLYALAQIDVPLARRMLADLLEDFRTDGICECVHVGYRKLEHYVVSVVNPLGALRRVPWLDDGV